MPESLDVRAQAAQLLGACGLIVRDDLVRIRVTGGDRIDYLHRMLTQDIRGLSTGAATYACLLTIKGRILGDMVVWNQIDHVVLEMSEAAQAAVMAPLERYVIADEVVFEAAPPTPRHTVVGPTARACLEAAGVPVPDQACVASRNGLQVLRHDLRGLPLFELVGPLDAFDLAGAGLPVVGMRAFEMARVQHCIPAFGTELGEDVLFNEAGLEEAVSWTKGCFPGQEPVVMAKHRGKPPRRLVQLACEAAAPGTDLLHEGKAVGRITSVAPAADRWPGAALGYVRHALAACEALFELETGGTAVVQAVSGEPVPIDPNAEGAAG